MLTIGILVGIGLRKLPSNAAKLEHELSVQTGLQWKIHAVEFRKPGGVRLRNVHVIDDVSTKSVFETKEIVIEKLKNQENENYLLVRIPISALKLGHYDSDQAAAQAIQSLLSKLLARFPLLAPPMSEGTVGFDFETVGIFTTHRRKKPSQFELLQSLRGNLYRTEDGVRSDWSFELPAVSPLETQRLSFFRRHTTGGTEIEFRTGKIPIPASMVSPFCPVFQRLGLDSKFSGEFSVTHHSDGGLMGFQSRTVQITNAIFQNIDVGPIAAVYTAFPVTGTVDALHIRKATFGPTADGEECFFADGALKILGGDMDATLFNRIVRQFNLAVDPGELLESPLPIVFDECALQFQMHSDGLAFWPDENWDNVFMYRKGDGFRTESMTVRFPKHLASNTPSSAANRMISYHALLSVLAPDTAPVVPLTPSLKQLYSVIPTESELHPSVTQKPVQQPAMTYPAMGNAAEIPEIQYDRKP